MYFEDLTPYSYYLPYSINEVRNIGWLSKEYEFNKGDVPTAFSEKLRSILKGSDSFKAQVNLIRGIHPCNFCGRQQSDVSTGLGSCEIWIPDSKGGYFAAPSQIIHYIKEHNYQPPEEFIQAANDVVFTDAFNGQDIYDSFVRKYADKAG